MTEEEFTTVMEQGYEDGYRGGLIIGFILGALSALAAGLLYMVVMR